MATKPKHVINDPANAVEEFLQGLLMQYPNRLVKLANHHVVLKAERKSQIQLLSGGGSGHEPAHAGFIGSGMLAGAICGGIFASPSVHSVLAAIRAASQGKMPGVLLIVKNYTGDRLNFGMAIEKANMEGIPCRMVVAADDCALERTKGITGARGIAGTVFLHKILGAAAAVGKSLDELVSLAKQVNASMGSMGIALGSVTVPGADVVNDRLEGGGENPMIEIGLGIHGEAGLRQSPLLSSDEMAKEMISTIQNYGRSLLDEKTIVPMFQESNDLCILVNNLGGTSNFEMSIFAHSCVKILEEDYKCRVSRVFVGSFMTSFGMHGVSLTILNLHEQPGMVPMEQLIQYLDAPTDAPAWATCDIWTTTTTARPSATLVPEVTVASDDGEQVKMTCPPLSNDLASFGDLARKAIQAAAKALIDQEPMLTKYDTIVGDGDCGITMKRGATELLKRLEDGSLPTDHPVTMFAAIADAVSASMGGTSGVLLELFFRKMSSTLSTSNTTIGLSEFQTAFSAGVDAIGLYGGAKVGSRTMLDALVPAAEAFVSTGQVSVAASKAKEGADGTALLKTASAGRSNYLSEDQLAGTPDPGAVAVAIVLTEIAAL